MIQYLLEIIVFQLVFLMVYDLFLKKETFFQWNRVYLLGTFVFAMVLPWIKIEAWKFILPVKVIEYPESLWNLNSFILTEGHSGNPSFPELLNPVEWAFVLGSVIMMFWFFFKSVSNSKLTEEWSSYLSFRLYGNLGAEQYCGLLVF